MPQLTTPIAKATFVVVSALIVVGLLFAVAWHPAPIASTATSAPSKGGSGSNAPSAVAVAPSSPATPTPTLGPCLVPESLPVPDQPVDTPVVALANAEIVFASNTYGRNGTTTPVLLDGDAGWGMGLWLYRTGFAKPKLIAETRTGTIVPLAFSGAQAVVWWLPERRTANAPACLSGIYLVDMDKASSHLLVEGNWSVTDPQDEPTQGGLTQVGNVTYRLPKASFSSTGTYLALQDGRDIQLYFGAFRETLDHVGDCPDTAWAPDGNLFVAACDSASTAWIADPSTGDVQQLAMPWIGDEARRSGWGSASATAVGFTSDGRLRVAGFYGFATECPRTPCPKPAYSITTLNVGTMAAVTRTGAMSVFADQESPVAPRFSGLADWLYVETSYDQGSARTLSVPSGALRAAPRLGEIDGESTFLGGGVYSTRSDKDSPDVTIIRLNPSGSIDTVGTIAWPVGADTNAARITVVGLHLIEIAFFVN